MISDYFYIVFHINDKDFLDDEIFKKMPLLKGLKHLGIPEPIRIEYYTKTLKDKTEIINGWNDTKLYEALNPDNRHSQISILTIYFDLNLRFKINIKQENNSKICITLPIEYVNLIGNKKILTFFNENIFTKNWYFCSLFFVESTVRLIENIGILKKRGFPFYIFSWLQYLSAALIEEEGGFEAFENNPLLKCERTHDGLLVQVGESPYDIFTPEGEALLVKATLSLPPTRRSLTKRLVFPTLNKVLKEYERLKNNNEDMSYYDLYYKKNNITRNLTSKQIEEYYINKTPKP